MDSSSLSSILSWATAVSTLAAALFALILAGVALFGYRRMKHFIQKYIDDQITSKINASKEAAYKKAKQGAKL